MLKLYYSPAAISLVTHIALEETGVPYQLQKVAIREAEHLSEAYRRIHPLARVPALEIATGEVLTETPALLWYLSGLAPGAGLMPEGALPRARADEWMSLLASAVHVAFISFFRPARFADDAAAKSALAIDGKGRFLSMLQYIEAKLPERDFLFGPNFSLCDAYVVIFYLWGRHFELPVETLPRYSRLAEAVVSRAAVRRAVEQEGVAAMLAPAKAGAPS